MIDWLNRFVSYREDSAFVDIVSIEVTMKEPASTQDGGILSTVRDWAHDHNFPISSFQTVPEYVADNRGQFFYAANGKCCFFTDLYLYNWPNKNRDQYNNPRAPNGVPYDHSDNRGDPDFLVNENLVRMATTDRPDVFEQYLLQNNRRHTDRYVADANTPQTQAFTAPEPLTLTASSKSIASGTQESFAVAVYPASAAGTISLSENGSVVANGGIDNGVAQITITSPTDGSHTYTAIYGDPSSPNAISSNSVTITVGGNANATTGGTAAPNGSDPLPSFTPGETSVRRPDPSVILVNGTYYSVESSDGAGSGPASLFVRAAQNLSDLQNAQPSSVFSDTQGLGEVWAPEFMNINGTYYIYFSMGAGAAHRMYVISSPTPQNGYGSAVQLNLPDNKWAIDGTTFSFQGQRYFAWSGWDGDTNVEQNLYIAKMSDPLTVSGPRFVISQAREPFERVVGNPFINEAPEAIIDPNSQLHIVYSTNGSWSSEYCLGDLRLRSGGDPTYVWDWYKSAGCLFGSDGRNMEPNGWYPALYAQGPGHHTFALQNGDINNSPQAAYPNTSQIMYAAVPNGMQYKWANRTRYVGAFTWYNNINYNRCCVPDNNTDTGYTPMFFEDPNFTPNSPPAGPPAGSPGYTGIHGADPSVIRQGGTYSSVEVAPDGHTIWLRQADLPGNLSHATPSAIFDSGKAETWAPKLVFMEGYYYVYYSAAMSGAGSGHRMYYAAYSGIGPNAQAVDSGEVYLPDDKWAVDGNYFEFGGHGYFIWSGWDGDTNVEQNLYITPMTDPTHYDPCGGGNCSPNGPQNGVRSIISQPRESWERVVGNPYINEAPMPIVDPNGQLHIFYSANGSWSDQYCIADLRLRNGGSPTYVWDWYKSNGCEFGSNTANMMSGWDPTKYVNGPGSHSFVLENGDVSTSPPAGPVFPLMYTAVPKGTDYSWGARMWFNGSFQWWNNTTYSRSNVPGPNSDTGFALKFYEGPTAPQ